MGNSKYRTCYQLFRFTRVPPILVLLTAIAVSCSEDEAAFVEEYEEDAIAARRVKGSVNTETQPSDVGYSKKDQYSSSINELSDSDNKKDSITVNNILISPSSDDQPAEESYASESESVEGDPMASQVNENSTEHTEDHGTNQTPEQHSEPPPMDSPEPEPPSTDPGQEGIPGYEPMFVELTQTGSSKVDILWVVDSSASMAEEQAYLGANFDAFINQLAAMNGDFQTSITTMDICHDQTPTDLSQVYCPHPFDPGDPSTHLRGKFVGDDGRKVLKYDDADLIDRFNSYTQVGINSSSFEHGLKAAEMAISKSLNGTNESLIRDDSFLAIVVVSDEEDDGIGLGQPDGYWLGSDNQPMNFVELGLTTHTYSENDFIDYVKSVKGDKFAISTIAATRDDNDVLCTSPHSMPVEESTQYIAAAKKTGGVVQSICDQNWDQSLAQIGFDLNAQINQVQLDTEVVPETIEVYINGNLDQNWTYIETTHSIKFLPNHIPAPGDLIRVDFWGKP